MKTNYEICQISWNDYDNLISSILKQLDGKKIDVLCPILRGGAVIGLSLANNLSLPTSYLRIKRSLSNEPNSDFGEAHIVNSYNMIDIKDKTILICEDTIDTEQTILCATKFLQQYNPKHIYVATLYNFSKNNNYIAGKFMSEHKWIEFPWERRINDDN